MNPVSSGNVIHAADLDAVINWLTGTITSDATVTVVAPGDLKFSAVASAPAGWLLCDGSAVSRTTYANLFAAIGTTFGSGNGSTTFNVPDLRGRVPVGAGTGAGLTARALGANGGEEAHTLLSSEAPTHSHGGITASPNVAHSHTATPTAASGYGGGTTYVTASGSFASGTVSISTAGETIAHGHAIPTDGGGGSHNNMQPFAVVNVFIKI